MILEISVAVIAFFILIFVIGLLIVLVQIRRTAKEAEKFLDTTRQNITPIAHDLAVIINDIQKIVESIQSQMSKVEQGVDSLRDAAVRIGEFEKILQEKLEKPIIEIVTLISAILKALHAFIKFWTK